MQTNRISRRELGALALGGLALPSAAQSLFTEYRGVRLGVGSFPYRTMPLDELIRVMQTGGAGLLELEASFVEPVAPGAQRGAGRPTPEQREWIRQWRLNVPLEEISAIRARLDKAGIELSAYAMPINATYNDAEMERAFQIAKALRVPTINTQADIPLARRLASLAEKYDILVGLHPAGNAANPESIGTGASYARVFAISGRLRANLDQHLFRDWGPEPLDFVRQHHDRISTVHFHDRRVLSEPHDWLPFGEGDTPVKEMLLLAKSQRYRFPFSIEVVYRTDDPAGEMRRQIEYCRRVLD